MAQIFSRRSNGLTTMLLAGGLITLVFIMVVAWGVLYSPYNSGQFAVPEQPVPFSHQHHAGALGIDCQYCHTGVDRSPFAGLPDTETCMSCHSQLWTNADMLAPVRQSLAQDRPLAWVRVHDLPDFVYFNHEAHINNGVGCESCHGRVDQMPLTFQAKPLSMRWCLDCHNNPGPRLRPRDKVTTMGYHPAQDPDRPTDTELVRHYGIPQQRMTDCVTCHR